MKNQYIETALWSSVDNDGDPLDEKYSIEDLSEDALKKAQRDLDLFTEKAGSLLDDLDLETVAHDFWLTRNGHGAGFWDGDYPTHIGEKLTDISRAFGSTDIYIGDDGKLHFSGGRNEKI